MIIDGLLQLASAQAVTASAVSQNTIDFGAVPTDLAGRSLTVAITVDQTVLAAGAATVQFQLLSSTNPSLGSPRVLVQTPPISKAELTAGRRPILLKVPNHSFDPTTSFMPRYLGVNFNVGTGPLTAGQFSANVVADPQDVGTLYPANQPVY